jgi:hypothetical protein
MTYRGTAEEEVFLTFILHDREPRGCVRGQTRRIILQLDTI